MLLFSSCSWLKAQQHAICALWNVTFQHFSGVAVTDRLLTANKTNILSAYQQSYVMCINANLFHVGDTA